MKLTLVTGGARSGKSSFAQRLASEKAINGQKAGIVYLATALVGDEEMQRRVNLHRQSRPRDWKTIEEPYDLAAAVELIPDNHLLLVDCVTFWITNMLFEYLGEGKSSFNERQSCWDTASPSILGQNPLQNQEDALEKYVLEKTELFIKALNQRNLTGILVSNEVGWGIVPEHYLGRVFRDLAGRVNQKIASQATEVYLVATGIPLKIKG
ncbi:MAG: bifunctional adenosylcobinamide kinase/adenosylcobinamide-phosphate guanylyltransferase [Dethiobacteria bacterium]|jgi:adenosylcobinamide kinase/adenosylcobinamide-phosphate guanylyltransferase